MIQEDISNVRIYFTRAYLTGGNFLQEDISYNRLSGGNIIKKEMS